MIKFVSCLSSILKELKWDCRPITHRLTDAPTTDPTNCWTLIIFERHDNRNIFILQNTNTARKTYNYTSVYYPEIPLASIKHIRRSQLYSFSSFKTLMLYFSPDISKFKHSWNIPLLLTLNMFLSAGVYSEVKNSEEFWKITLFTRSRICKGIYDEVPS